MAGKMIQRSAAKTHHRSTSQETNAGTDQRSCPASTRANGAWVPDRTRFCCPPNPEPAGKAAARTLSGKSFDLQHAHDDFIRAKEQLGLLEKSKSTLMHDLTRAKRNMNQLTIKLHGTTLDTSKAAPIAARGATTLDAQHITRASGADGSDQLAALQSIDRSSLYQEWKAELEKMKAQYEGALSELQSNKQALESLKHELVFCVQAKDEAVRLAGEAMNAAEKTARRVEELSGTLYATPKDIDGLAMPRRSCTLGDEDSGEDAMAEIEILKRELAKVEASDDHHKAQSETPSEHPCCPPPKEGVRKDDLAGLMAAESIKPQAAHPREGEDGKPNTSPNKTLEDAEGAALSKALEDSFLSSCLELLKTELEQTKAELLALKAINATLLCEAFEKEEAQLGDLLAVLSKLEVKAKEPLALDVNDKVESSYPEQQQQQLVLVLEEAQQAVAEHQARCQQSREKYAVDAKLYCKGGNELNELETLRARLDEAQAEANEANKACDNAQRKLREALIEIEVLRSCKYAAGDELIKKRKLAVWTCIGNWIP